MSSVVSPIAMCRPRFSLKLLLFAVLVVCVALALVRGRLASHAAAIKAIETNGGAIRYRGTSSLKARISTALFADNRLLSVASVEIHGRALNAESRRALPRLGTVTTLAVTSVALSRLDLDAIYECKTIRELTLHGCQFEDRTLGSLAQFPRLESLNLGMSNVSDAAIPSILGQPHLHSLYVHGTDITDLGLTRLQALPNLQRMTLSRHVINQEAIEAFSQQKPSVTLTVFGP